MACRALFIGGIKSGKSKNAENYVLKKSKHIPIYLATTEFVDDEMQTRIEAHKLQRNERFLTVEEPLNLPSVLHDFKGIVLIECVSMWINNLLYHGFTEDDMIKQIDILSKLDAQIVFVQNDVGCSVVGADRLTRDFVDINGRVSQYLAAACKEVYNNIAGIAVKIK
ncbi:bifunctional adenosylcobinamide kinase/adenosylcobinamide-phosphate guanylyltransferase [Sulfurimonas sp. HSL-1716]|uniref:bifunctional adenosylcobinamide kinase/adenosylcobinamide-phosphate guanylyltransferase n=1 Tax=Hydrocurvibacter sulfurireducens TaxID=3131937 RepID=UPI0031F85ABF